MSRAHIEELKTLGDECRRVLKEVRSGTPADFLHFSEEFDAILARLPAPAELKKLSQSEEQELKRVLRDVERIRKQLASELMNIRGDLVNKLTDMSKGQIGLDAYRKALVGTKSGTRRGSG
ncbi:MAG: hypothetical protein VYA30_05395 [Myxococcota bacterium]|nr:hypothetical protein [Myxococcota bacterium]